MTWFRALGDFDFDHANLIERGLLAKQFVIKASIVASATKVTGTDLPNEVSTFFAMVRA